jgi:hypothetical protein
VRSCDQHFVRRKYRLPLAIPPERRVAGGDDLC